MYLEGGHGGELFKHDSYAYSGSIEQRAAVYKWKGLLYQKIKVLSSRDKSLENILAYNVDGIVSHTV